MPYLAPKSAKFRGFFISPINFEAMRFQLKSVILNATTVIN